MTIWPARTIWAYHRGVLSAFREVSRRCTKPEVRLVASARPPSATRHSGITSWRSATAHRSSSGFLPGSSSGLGGSPGSCTGGGTSGRGLPGGPSGGCSVGLPGLGGGISGGSVGIYVVTLLNAYNGSQAATFRPISGRVSRQSGWRGKPLGRQSRPRKPRPRRSPVKNRSPFEALPLSASCSVDRIGNAPR